ncbi:hypothetical protein [Mesorhizobium sp.]|uniref:hypothetical protein n=1 Tax=Mesorhizobium sp. TaxID=1871066 RepID=UPI002580AE6A|nr:hypothetical protein [Mesorhizobium sp.]
MLAVGAAFVTGDRWPYAWMAADLILFAVRFLLMRECERTRKRGGTGPLAGLMAAGGSWSVIFGLGCYGCVISGIWRSPCWLP